MYIWTAIDVDSQLAALRRKAEAVTSSIGSDNSALTLPLHISLRISFPADDARFEEIIGYIARYLGSQSPFAVEVQGIENFKNIVWLKVKSNPRLQEIHTWLVDSLARKYGIGTHAFDSDFMYHISLFTDDDPAKAAAAYTALSSEPVPPSLAADRFVIGVSESGRAGEYRVAREIALN